MNSAKPSKKPPISKQVAANPQKYQKQAENSSKKVREQSKEREEGLSFDFLMKVADRNMESEEENPRQETQGSIFSPETYRNITSASNQSSANKENLEEGNGLKTEVESISSKEKEIMRKAQELEREMQAIRNAKVMVVVKQFEQQLLEDAEKEEERFMHELNQQFEKKRLELEQEKKQEVGDIMKLQQSLESQIEFFKTMLGDLQAKKGEVESTFEAAVQGLKREREEQKQSQKAKLVGHIEQKKSIFQQYLAEQ